MSGDLTLGGFGERLALSRAIPPLHTSEALITEHRLDLGLAKEMSKKKV